jgi:hypothetical protein
MHVVVSEVVNFEGRETQAYTNTHTAHKLSYPPVFIFVHSRIYRHAYAAKDINRNLYT